MSAWVDVASKVDVGEWIDLADASKPDSSSQSSRHWEEPTYSMLVLRCLKLLSLLLRRPEEIKGRDSHTYTAPVRIALHNTWRSYRIVSNSGTWVHGEDRVNTTSERSPPKDTTKLVSWRTTVEQKVLANAAIDGIVIRGALLYGRSASILHYLFAQAGAGKTIEWGARPGGRWGLVHQDDLADLFLRVAEAAPICRGLIFDGVNERSESVEDVLAKVVEVSGSSGYKLREPNSCEWIAQYKRRLDD